MILEFSERVPSSPEKVYAALLDPVVIQRCIDGCESMIPSGENTYDIKVKGGLKGRVQLLSATPNESLTLAIDGKSLAGSIKASVQVRLLAGGNSTELRGTGEVKVGGFLMALGSKLIESGARKAIADFFSALSAQITSSGA